MKKLFLTLAMLLFAVTGTMRATDVVVGSFSYSLSYVPTYTYYNYTVSEQIYTADEIGMEGTIMGISFYRYSGSADRTFMIYMAEVEEENLSAGWINLSSSNLVFSGNIGTGTGWIDIPLDNEFEYSGEGNLLVCVNDVTGSYTTTNKFIGFTSSGMTRFAYNDNSAYSVSSLSGGYTYGYRNYIALEIKGAANVTSNVNPIAFGYRPNGYWMEPQAVKLTNEGRLATINVLEPDNTYFETDAVVPFSLDYLESLTINATTNSGEVGEQTGNLAIAYEDDRTVTVIPMTATAYNASATDVWELAQEVTTFPFQAAVAVEDEGIQKNYNLNGTNADMKDVVYKVTFDSDVVLNAGATEGVTAIYTEDFNGQPGPMSNNTYNGPVIGHGGDPGANVVSGDWYYYGDDVIATNVGAGGAFYWAVMFPAGTYEGSYVTKVAYFDDGYPFDGTATIYSGGDSAPGTAMGTMDISVPGDGSGLNELEFTTPVAIDETQNLWVVFYNGTSSSYPATANTDCGDANARWVGVGGDWYDLASVGLPGYSWMLRAYVQTGLRGEIHEISVAEQPTSNSGRFYALDNRASVQLLNEDFEGGEMPTDWTYESSASGTWTVGTGDYSTSTGAANGTYNALCKHSSTGATTYLVTPAMDLSAASGATVTFNFINRSWGGDIDGFAVCYRVNGGDWNELFTTTTAHGSWTAQTVTLSGLAANYQLGFRMTDNYGYGVGLDDVIVNASQPLDPQYQITDMFVQAGTYYMVFASASDEMQVDIATSAAPAPGVPVITYPADGDVDIDNPTTLAWNLGDYTGSMKVLLGTQYPPTDVLLDWTQELISDYVTTSLMHNKTYFMQVLAANATDTVASEIVGFTTTLDGVAGFAVEDPELYPGDSAVFTWTANRTFRGYNMYQDGVKLNDELITATTYVVNDLEYYMDGYEFQISAVYGEGESALSEPILVYMTGNGTVSGTVYEQDSTTIVEGATVTLTGTDEYGNTQTFNYTTDENGTYSGEALAGNYRASATKDGYQTCRYDGTFDVVYDTETSGIDIILYEEYYPLGQITATEQPDENNVLVEWSWTPGSLVVDFETGDFSQAEFDNTVSSYPWAITTSNPYEGTYCMKSTCEGVASGQSAIEATVDVPFDALMGFYVKVSTEANYDKFHFYIDGVEQGSAASGNLAYSYKQYAVEAGTHTYRWEYQKDSSVNSNDDCVYVDAITMYEQPAPPTPGAQTYDFEDGTTMGWTSIDNDGDGYGWELGSEVMGTGYGHNSSNDCVLSRSYVNYVGALTPDNYFVAPQQFAIQSGASISFWACAQDAGYPAEHFGVAVSTTSATAAAFTTIQEWTLTAKGNMFNEETTGEVRGTRTQGTWYQYTADLSSYAGQDIWVALRHFNCTDQFYLVVDDITINDGSAKAAVRGGNRSLASYNLYRRDNNLEEPVAELIATPASTDTAYIDNDWADLTFGVYQWGIQAYYEGNAPTDPNRDEFTVYEGTATSNYVPVYGLYTDAYLRCQYVVPASDLSEMAGGEISSMTFALSSSAAAAWTATFEVYLTEVSSTSISEFIDPATATTVYTGTLDATGSEMVVTFDEPYTYNGGNLLIGIDDVAPGNYKSCSFYGTSVEGACVQGYSYSSLDAVSPTQRDFIPQTTFEFTAGYNGLSTILWSNEIEKDMYSMVTVNVTLNNGQSPEGAVVTMGDYTAEVDETGTVVLENVRKSDYTLTVTKEEFNTYTEDVTLTEDEHVFNVVLEETIGVVSGLYVSPTGWAMWDGPMPGGVNGGGGGGGGVGNGQWYYYDDGVSANNIGAGGAFWWAVMFPAGSYTGDYVTKVATYDAGYAFTGTATVYVGGSTTPGTAVGSVDVSTTGSAMDFVEFEFAEPISVDDSQNLWIVFYNSNSTQYPAAAYAQSTSEANARWVSVDGSSWMDLANAGISGYGWMIRAYVAGSADGVAHEITPIEMPEQPANPNAMLANKPGNRAPLSYKVMIDGTFEADCEYACLQHDVEGFEEGSEHTTSVMAIYATGTSDWVTYDWVYSSCENYEGATGVSAVQNGNDVTINFTLPSGGGGGVGNGQWYYYDDGVSANNIGAGGAFWWAVMFPAGSYTGDYVTKVATYDAGYAFTGTATVYVGGATSPTTAVGSVDVSTTGSAMDFVEFEFAEPISIDDSQNLWIVFYNSNSTQYPAAAYAQSTSEANARWVSVDGSSWMDLANAGISGYGWMIRAYVAESADGVAHEITPINVPAQPANPNAELMAHRDNLYDPLYVTDPAGMPNGADASFLYGSQTTLGPGAQQSSGNIVADDFTLTSAATITEIEVYGYQTGSTTTSTFTGLYAVIYDGNPMNGANIVWGDMNTNIMTSTAFTNCYRSSSSNVGTTRPIMSLTASNLNIQLEAGTYYLAYNMAGSGSSGPWAQPEALPNVGNNGNGVQYLSSSSAWQNLTDTGAGTSYGVAFKLVGTGGGGATGDVLGAFIFRDGELITGEPITTDSYTDPEAAQGEHEYCVRVVYSDYSMSCPVCVDLEHQCVEVTNLQGEYQWFLNDNDEEVYGVNLTWECELDEFVQQYIVYFGDVVTAYTPDLEFFVDMTGNPGVYSFGVVADYGYCQSEMVTVEVNVTGVNEFEANAKLYPNPTNSNVTIEAAGMNHITVVSAIGQVVYDADVDADMLQLNLGQYKAGVYMVRINTVNGIAVKRVTVVK